MTGLVVILFLIGAFLECFQIRSGSKFHLKFRKDDWSALLGGTLFALIALIVWLWR